MDLLPYEETETPVPECMNRAGQIAADTHEYLEENVQEGLSTNEMDQMAVEFMRDHDGEPAFYDTNQFSHGITVSVNDQLIHTPPSPEQILESGDIVSIDLGVKFQGHYSDTAQTIIVGAVDDEEHIELIEQTKTALFAGIMRATAGNTIQDIGQAIEKKSRNFGNIRQWAGHFIGRQLHLGPQVNNTAQQTDSYLLKSGMYLAIEPILTLQPEPIAVEERPGGTVRTSSGQPGAHFEHTIRVEKEQAAILTARSNEPSTL